MTIKLSKRIIRDLDNYLWLVDKALDLGKGKYAHISAKSLHDMISFYILARYTTKLEEIEDLESFYFSHKRLKDFKVPVSILEWMFNNLCKLV